MERITTIAAMRTRIREHRLAGRTVALVPTMGALHEGHLSLVHRAASEADVTVVSIFVNPTQFDRADDLSAYPRDLAGDEGRLRGLAEAAPAIVFAPAAEELYPRPPVTAVTVAGLDAHLCGASRPGHFAGVGLVVTKLFAIVTPDVAVFGRKDRQQLQIVRRLTEDLDLGVRIVAGPTVREADGLARSSRNQRLGPDDRPAARRLSEALRAAVLDAREARRSGAPIDPTALLATARGALDDPRVVVDYLEVVDPDTMAPTREPLTGHGRLVVAVAAEVGPVRLIDNVEVGDIEDEDGLLAATAGDALPHAGTAGG